MSNKRIAWPIILVAVFYPSEDFAQVPEDIWSAMAIATYLLRKSGKQTRVKYIMSVATILWNIIRPLKTVIEITVVKSLLLNKHGRKMLYIKKYTIRHTDRKKYFFLQNYLWAWECARETEKDPEIYIKVFKVSFHWRVSERDLSLSLMLVYLIYYRVQILLLHSETINW